MKLISFYCLFYFGIYFWIGICVPGNFYWPFAEKYLNIMAWLKTSLTYTAGFFAEVFGYDVFYPSVKQIKVINGHGVTIANSCSGYGIMSAWAAFIVAFPAKILSKRIKWMLLGLTVIWFINVIRIFALVVAVNQEKDIDINHFGEHHDVFNFVVYTVIIIMIYFYTKSSSKKPQKTKQ